MRLRTCFLTLRLVVLLWLERPGGADRRACGEACEKNRSLVDFPMGCVLTNIMLVVIEIRPEDVISPQKGWST